MSGSSRRSGPDQLDRRQGVDDQGPRGLRARGRGARRQDRSASRSCSTARTSAQVQDTQYYDYAESVPGPDDRALPGAGQGARHGHGPADLRAGAAGFLYNTAAVVDADGSYLGKYRKHHIPHLPRLLGEVLLPARQPRLSRSSTPRSARSASTSATTGTSPRAGARWVSTARRSCSTRRPPAAACRTTCGSSSSRPPRWPTSTSSAPSTGSASRTARRQRLLRHVATSSTRDGNYRRRRRRRAQAGARRPRPRPGPDPPRSATAGRSTATGDPDAYGTWSRPERRSAHDVLITGGTVVSADRVDRPPTCSSTARRIAALLAARVDRCSASDLAASAERVIDATGKYVIPGGIDGHTHMELPFGGTVRLGHLRDRHPGRGLGRHHDDRRLRRAAHGRARAGRAGRLARQGRRAMRDRLRVPPDHRRRRRRLAQGHGRAGRRGHHELQALHGLPGRLLQRRRPDPAGDADGRAQRRA